MLEPTHVKDVCKIGQGNLCCRYLVVGKDGFECVKLLQGPCVTLYDKIRGMDARLTPKQVIDQKVAQGEYVAEGDNCEGRLT